MLEIGSGCGSPAHLAQWLQQKQNSAAKWWRIQTNIWNSIREQTNDFFKSSLPLWRLSVPSVATPISLAGKQLIEWGGAQRWLLSDASHETIRDAVEKIGGHATRFRNDRGDGAIFHPLAPAVATLHRRLKSTFDPRGILNPGRMDNF